MQRDLDVIHYILLKLMNYLYSIRLKGTLIS